MSQRATTAVSEGTKRQYDERGYGHGLEWGKRPAVVVVDFQQGLTGHGRFPLASDFDAEVEATRRLVDAARESGCPVIFVVLAFKPDGSDGGIMARKIPPVLDLVVGTEATEVDPRLGRRPDEPVVVKALQSAFFDTDLRDRLLTLEVDTVLVAGCTTSGCVRATVTDASAHGFVTVLVTDCVGDQTPEPHAANLFDMASKNADLASLELATEYLHGVRTRR